MGPVAPPGHPARRGSIVYLNHRGTNLSVDIGIAHVRDVVMPALQEIDGCVGELSLVVDQQSGVTRHQRLGDLGEAMRASVERRWHPSATAPRWFAGSAQVENGTSPCCTATTVA